MKPLSDIMEFGHVIRVHDDGDITDGPEGVYAPELDGEQLLSDDWTLMSGWTGQYAYNGPVMHPSEYIGGRLETYIRETPGLYVALVVEEHGEEEPVAYGWAIATRSA